MIGRFTQYLQEDALPLTLALVGVGVLTAASWSGLPAEVPIHWNWAGEADGFASRAVGAALMPLTAAFSWFIVAMLVSVDPRRANNDDNPDIIALFRLATPLLLLAIHVAMLFVWLDSAQFDFVSMLYAGVGLLFAVFGNFMPRLRSNFMIGIRVPWTLDDDVVWRQTHRMAGPLWVVGGLAIVGTGLLPATMQLVYMLAVTLVITISPVVFAYHRYSRRP